MPVATAADSVTSIPCDSLPHAGAALSERPHVRRGIPTPERPIRLLLADDHIVMRHALKLMLQRAAPEVTVVGEASTGSEAVSMALRAEPDVIVMDLDMPDGDGEEATRTLMAQSASLRVLILTMHAEEDRLLELLRCGVRGYLRKDADDQHLVDAIRVVAAGDFYVRPSVARRLAESLVPEHDRTDAYLAQYERLSDREQTVLRLVAIGYNGPEIGRQLGITAKTVDTYRQRIEEKLGFSHRTGYVRFALQAGLLSR